jgi:hypothetical protein
MNAPESHVDHDGELRELETSELVRELVTHGKRVIEGEVRSLRAELARDIGQARDDLRAELGAATEEARGRLASGLDAVKHDVREQVDRATSAAKPMAIGGVLLHAALFLLCAALALGLGTLMPLWVATLLTGLVAGGAGALLLKSGTHAARQVGRNPLNRTNRQLRENKRWMSEIKDRMASRMRELRSGLRGDVLPRLRQSFAGARGPNTSGNRLGAR